MRWLVALLVLATPAAALDLTYPGAEVVAVETTDAGTARLPEGPWSPGTVTAATEGAIRKTVLELPSQTLTSLQLLGPLRDALVADGYTPVFACADAECGGFDFRFQLDLIGEPQMHVDLGNYRYLLMRKAGASPHSVAIVTSPALASGFIHVTEVSDALFPEPQPLDTSPQASQVAPTTDLGAQLVDVGHVVLADLEFETGSSDLGGGPFASLDTLAAWLTANPTARVVVVGHTDSVGSLEANTALSRRRAGSVVERLVTTFGVDAAQMQSAGAGFLSPVQSNLTPEGRAANRRVEVVLLTLE